MFEKTVSDAWNKFVTENAWKSDKARVAKPALTVAGDNRKKSCAKQTAKGKITGAPVLFKICRNTVN